MFDFEFDRYVVYYHTGGPYHFTFDNIDDVEKCVRDLIYSGEIYIRVVKVERCDVDVTSL